MFCRPSHNFGAKLEKLQISVLIMSAILDSWTCLTYLRVNKK
jgi:hypothetical protein